MWRAALAVASHKGGVGRTTIALNLAFALAGRGWRVLVAELDPTGGFGLSLPTISKSPGVFGWLEGATLSSCTVKTRLDALTLLPVGNVPLLESAAFHERLENGREVQRLAAEASKMGFDCLLLDTPAGLTGATLGAIRGGEELLVPVQAEPMAARAISAMLEALGALRSQGAKGSLLGFVVSMLQPRDPDSLSVAVDLWSELPSMLVFESVIPRDSIFLRATTAGVPLGLLRRQVPPMVRVFDRLAEEVEHRLRLRHSTENEDEDEDTPVSLFA